MNNSIKIFGFFLTLLFLNVSQEVYGQTPERSRRTQLETAKIALITERLQLSPSEAQSFWPVYNEYHKQRESIRKEYISLRTVGLDGLSETQAQELLNKRLELRKKEVVLEEKYTKLLVEATSVKQVLALSGAEAEFRRLVLQKIRNR